MAGQGRPWLAMKNMETGLVDPAIPPAPKKGGKVEQEGKRCLGQGLPCPRQGASVCRVRTLSEALSAALSVCLVGERMSAAKTLVGPFWRGLAGGLVSDKVFVGHF